MKRKYRIEFRDMRQVYLVRVKRWFGWVTIKEFEDKDIAFAKREAEELLETLEGGKEIKVKLINR